MLLLLLLFTHGGMINREDSNTSSQTQVDIENFKGYYDNYNDLLYTTFKIGNEEIKFIVYDSLLCAILELDRATEENDNENENRVNLIKTLILKEYRTKKQDLSTLITVSWNDNRFMLSDSEINVLEYVVDVYFRINKFISKIDLKSVIQDAKIRIQRVCSEVYPLLIRKMARQRIQNHIKLYFFSLFENTYFKKISDTVDEYFNQYTYVFGYSTPESSAKLKNINEYLAKFAKEPSISISNKRKHGEIYTK